MKVSSFVKDVQTCIEYCFAQENCNFYKFYPSVGGKPEQCFFYQTCGRLVSKSIFCYVMPVSFAKNDSPAVGNYTNWLNILILISPTPWKVPPGTFQIVG